MNISVIIPTYKNKQLLIANLKQNLPYLEGCEIIIINDNPLESLKTDLSYFRQVTLMENEKNLGFGMTVNRGVKQASSPYVLLLNTDVILHDDSFKKSIEHFMVNPALFGVTFAQKEREWTTVGKNIIYWKNGFILHKKDQNLTTGFTAWAEGGSCVLDRTKFLELGGFDDLYSPFYWEDIDLSYRAWKAGYEVVFDSTIVVEHQHETTIGKYFQSEKVKAIAYRNQFLFLWKNITDKNLVNEHRLTLPKHLLYYVLKGDFAFIKGFIQAVSKLPIQRGRVAIKRSDNEILSLFKY